MNSSNLEDDFNDHYIIIQSKKLELKLNLAFKYFFDFLANLYNNILHKKKSEDRLLTSFIINNLSLLI